MHISDTANTAALELTARCLISLSFDNKLLVFIWIKCSPRRWNTSGSFHVSSEPSSEQRYLLRGTIKHIYGTHFLQACIHCTPGECQSNSSQPDHTFLMWYVHNLCEQIYIATITGNCFSIGAHHLPTVRAVSTQVDICQDIGECLLKKHAASVSLLLASGATCLAREASLKKPGDQLLNVNWLEFGPFLH